MYYGNDYINEKREIPSSEQMIRPIMVALQELGGTASVDEIDSKVIEIMALPERLYTVPHNHTSSRTELSYRLAWARSCLKKYGWIVNITRGVWQISNSFNCPIEDIDPKVILKSIRQGNIVNGVPITNLESASAFEKFAQSVITSYIQGQNKRIEYPKRFSGEGYDLYLPDGFDDVDSPTYVIFKYSISNKYSYNKPVEGILSQFNEVASNACILIIFGAVLYNKKQLEKHVRSRYFSGVVT